ncbi:MAG: putative bifunctional diguanylate cyclase/phosphodiesterase [Actinomycetota bacterium]
MSQTRSAVAHAQETTTAPAPTDPRPRAEPPARWLRALVAVVLLAGAALAAAAALVGGRPAATILPWWGVAALLAAAQAVTIAVPGSQRRVHLSLEDVALALGVLLAATPALVLGGLVGAALSSLAIERRNRVKLAFNVGLTAVGIGTVPLAHRALLAGAEPLSGRGVVALVLALAAYGAVAMVLVPLAVALADGSRWRLPPLAAPLVVGEALLHGVLAIGLALVVVAVPEALWVVVLAFVAVQVAFRALIAIDRERKLLVDLQAFTHEVAAADAEAAVDLLLDKALALTRSTRGAVTVVDRDEEVLDHLEPLTVPDETSASLRRSLARQGQAVTVRPRPLRRGHAGAPTALLPGGCRDAVAVPFDVGERARGLLVVADRDRALPLSRADRSALAALADMGGRALEVALLSGELRGEVARRRAEALRDAVTGLPNRPALLAELERVLADGASPPRAALLVIDLARFSEVNAAFGHGVGDELLAAVARGLRADAPPGAFVARVGPDELAVLIDGLGDGAGAEEAAAALLASVRRPHRVGATTLALDAACGLVVVPAHGRDPATLLRRVAIAVDAAKRTRHGLATHAGDEDAQARRRLDLLADLRGAIDEGALDLAYQPKVSAADGRLVGAEALVRWHDPVRGSVSPAHFVPIAEQGGLVGPLTRVVLAGVLADVARWRDAGAELEVAVNLSARTLLDERFPEELAALLDEAGVPGGLLRVEVTESALIVEPELAAELLDRVHRLGVAVAIDDFGTGYSSLSHLLGLPLDELKIDRSFVARLDRAEEAAIVAATVEMAHHLGLVVTAEGVEDDAVAEAARDASCDVLQGFGIARPMLARAFERWRAGGGCEA